MTTEKNYQEKKKIFLFAEVLDWKTAGVFEYRSHLQVARLSSWKQFNLVEKLFKIRKMLKWSQFKVKVFFNYYLWKLKKWRFIYLLFCHTQWITSRMKTIINTLINIEFKICTLLGRSDCGGEISEKPSLWGIEISSHGLFKY